MAKLNRRDFIKITSTATLGAAVAPPLSSIWQTIFKPEEGPLLENEAEISPTVCEVCFWNCAGWVYKDKAGNIKKVIGNDLDPHSNGRLCPRGTGGLGMYYDNDRLKKPLIRVERNGKQEFREATWEEALDLVAENMKKIEQKYGKESMALLFHGKTGPHFEHLFKAWGSDTMAEPAGAQCLITREAGFIATYGAGLASPEPTDIRNTDCLVLIGSHFGENMHNGHVQEISDLIDRKGTIITVDPRFSTMAAHSTKWLPIKPGTDIALLLAWMNVIINEELYDKEYVEQYTYGFDLLKDHVQKYTPEWAESVTTIPAADIYDTARMMGGASPRVIIHPGRHTAWYGDDTQRTRSIAILNALLGSWGRKGGFYFPEKVKLPKHPHPPFPKPKWSWKDISRGKHKLAIMGITNELIDHALPDYNGPYKIKGMMIAATNPIQSIPPSEKVIKALQNQDFVVVIDTMPSEITGYADVVLPEATYLERLDHLRTSHHRQPNIALRYPAVKPKWETKPGWWIAREIGLRLGLKDYYEWEDFEEVLDWQLRQVGSSMEEMKKLGVKYFPRKTPMYLEEYDEPYWFNTNTGKIELFSTDFAEWGYDPMPVYKDHGDVPAGYLRLIYGRLPMHTFGRTLNNPYLWELRNEPHLWVHPKVAKIYGLENGQEVWLQNPGGKVSSFSIKVRITERIRHDSVFLPHGFGNKGRIFVNGKIEEMSRAYGRGISDSEMVHQVHIDPETGGTGLRNNFVKILTENPHKKEVVS